ncbi:phage tail protein [Aeromonas veronii]|uniref:phage tail-collar fiber domain-containing protein n=1 Tax=Aeromonas veronii TaxID=654 RepID=UPI0030054C34
MSQVITNAFEQYWQSSLAAEQPVVLDEFILADIPNLDITSPIDPDTGLPPESQIVHRQNVDQRGRINNNAVAYTIVMDTTVGDFSFNAMYLRNKQNGVIGMIVYKGRETKLKTDQTTGQTGNSLVKSMLMGYDQAAEATLTNVDAGTWQIDYAARLRGQDEDLRQLASQLYGHHTFIGDGFKVVQQDGGHQVTQGVAIVGGLRIELKQPEVIYPGTKPIGVWVDVHRSGSLLSEHQNHFTIITSVADLTDHVDESGYPHYVAKLGTVQADSTVIDGRGQGGSGGSGAIPDTFALWKRSMAEAGYDLIGKFGTKNTIETADQVLLSVEGNKVYAWAGELPKSVLTGSSPENSGGVASDTWVEKSDQLLSSSLIASSGSSKIGHGTGTVEKALEDLAAADNEMAKAINDLAAKDDELALQMDVKSLSPLYNADAAHWANGKKGTTILGDSICHGAFAGNLFSHGITRLLARAINAECGSSSYGFTQMTALGIGKSYESRDIHNVNFTNVGVGWVGQGAAAGSGYLNGFAFRSTNIGNKININLPSFQRRAVIHHANQAGGGTFTIKVNGVLAATVNTGTNTDKFSAAEVAANDNQYGVTTIEVETTNALPVDICGISYFSSVLEPVLQNMSDSGRRARYVSSAVVNEVCAQSSTVIFALGQNDYAETDAAYRAATIAVIDAMIAASNANGCRMVVPDFCWTAAGTTNWMRLQLKRLAVETNGIYIPFPDMLRKPDGSQPDSDYLVNTLGMWVDGSHPNVKGCQWIFETIAKCMGLSCSSKKGALTMHDYWVPLPLDSSVGVENSAPTAPSACRRVTSGVAVRIYIEKNPTGEFPIGSYALCSGFAARTDIVGTSSQTMGIVKQDLTSVIGAASFSPSGEVTVKVTEAATYNDLAFGTIIP